MKNICSNCETENQLDLKYCSNCGHKMPVAENENPNIEPIKKPVAKRKFNLKSIIGFIVAFVVVFFATQYFFKPSIDKELAEMASEMNKSCPMNVDEYTTLKNVVALPDKTLQYNYTLVISKEEIKVDTVKKYFFPSLLLNAKTNPGMKIIRDKKVTLNYYYADKNGNFVTEYVITPEMYE